MNRFLMCRLFALLAITAIFSACSERLSGPAESSQSVAERGYDDTYIVAFAGDAGGTLQTTDDYSLLMAKQILQTYKISNESITQVYNYVLKGFAVKLTPTQYDLLLKDSRVKSIEPDKLVTLPDEPVTIDDPGKQQKTLAQTVPWGVGVVHYYTYTGTNQAWIVDTGIDLDHSDLNVNMAKCTSFVKRELTADDQNGHGTHCAGIIAAKNNTYGVVGVAAGASVVGVKVLNKNGSGLVTDIVKGLDYVKSKAAQGDVCNLSLGGGPSPSLDYAVASLANSGVLVSVAAGNSKAFAGFYSPARVENTNVYTISAHDANDYFAYFSNYGNPPVDWCAPGVTIYSTYKGNRYATMSGTSMSAPHVAGILLYGKDAIGSRGYVKNDLDNNPDKLAELVK